MHHIKLRSLAIAICAIIAAGLAVPAGAGAKNPAPADLKARFAYLSRHGNSTCSQEFMASIASMSAGARLQGSCCSPMVLQRYIQQVRDLKKYASIPEIPPDPYDIAAGLARRMIAAYDAKLTRAQQASYDYAMRHSEEKGPCCCKCWRWRAYGGLAKLLIRSRGFTGSQVTEVWNLSDGCGGNG